MFDYLKKNFVSGVQLVSFLIMFIVAYVCTPLATLALYGKSTLVQLKFLKLLLIASFIAAVLITFAIYSMKYVKSLNMQNYSIVQSIKTIIRLLACIISISFLYVLLGSFFASIGFVFYSCFDPRVMRTVFVCIIIAILYVGQLLNDNQLIKWHVNDPLIRVLIFGFLMGTTVSLLSAMNFPTGSNDSDLGFSNVLFLFIGMISLIFLVLKPLLDKIKYFDYRFSYENIWTSDMRRIIRLLLAIFFINTLIQFFLTSMQKNITEMVFLVVIILSYAYLLKKTIYSSLLLSAFLPSSHSLYRACQFPITYQT